MEIVSRDLVSNEETIQKIDNYTLVDNVLKYSKDGDSYIWTFAEKFIQLEKIGDLSYRAKFEKGKLIPSDLRYGQYDMKVYFLTRTIQKMSNMIYLEYQMYSDENVNDLISSYEVKIRF